MSIPQIQAWILANPYLGLAIAVIIFVLIYLFTRWIFGRGLTYIASRTKNKYDDILVSRLRPFRTAWLVPFVILYSLSYLAPDYQEPIRKFSLFFITWLTALTLNALLNALNQIYESSPSFTGVSIQGYLDILKILILIVATILSVSLITGESPIILLSGLGALTAILLFVFQDTILSLIASIQISAHDLIKEGDWLDVPSYDANGIVTNMTLHTVKLQNWDMTISVIPTHKLMQVSYKNWRGMQESGGRRIMRAIHLDQTAIKFCDEAMLKRYSKIDLIADFVQKKQTEIESYRTSNKRIDSPLDGPQITNVEVFRTYVVAYLKNHPQIYSSKMDFLIRELEPSPTGLPIQVYVFTKTTKWLEYERIQAEIFDHLLAAAAFFDLRIFQEPAGTDFARAFRT
ncbi:MAG: mechanosensitive ion channel family protein [Anaerolineales bacterium]